MTVYCSAQLLSSRSGSPESVPMARRSRYACMSSSLVWKFNDIIAPPFYGCFFLPFKIFLQGIMYEGFFFLSSVIDTLKL